MSDQPAGDRLTALILEARNAARDGGGAGLTRRVLAEICQRFIDEEVERVLAIRTKISRVAAKPSSRMIDPVLHDIYNAYPRKIAPIKALAAIGKAVESGVLPSRLLAATEAYAAAVRGWPKSLRFKDGQDTVPYPASWFNAGRYNDDPKEWQARNPVPEKLAMEAVVIPNEPMGWREEFPEFISLSKRWEELEPYQHAHICTTMATLRGRLAEPPSQPSLLFPNE